MTMNSEAAVDSATGTFSPSPRWACAELLLAGALLVAGLTVQHVVFSASATPWLAAIGVLLLWWRGPGWRQLGLGRPASIRRTVAIHLGLYQGITAG